MEDRDVLVVSILIATMVIAKCHAVGVEATTTLTSMEEEKDRVGLGRDALVVSIQIATISVVKRHAVGVEATAAAAAAAAAAALALVEEEKE